VNAWLTGLQLLQEVELLADGKISTHTSSGVYLAKEQCHVRVLTSLDLPPGTGLHFRDSRDFQRHLGDKAKAITSRLETLLSRISGDRSQVKTDVTELETQVKALLAKQKDFVVKLERLTLEKEEMSEQLDRATLRYVKAEKKLDRTKSLQVQKLEQQAIANATARPQSAEKENGADASEANGDNEALRIQLLEATVVASKQKDQLESIFAEVKTLQDENSAFKSRREGTTDDDFARSEIFRQFKAQNEEMTKRINHLEATNKQLREDTERYQAERTTFQTLLEGEAQRATGELEDQIQVREQDLTRIRSARDELVADQSMRKASQDQERQAREHLEELISAQTDQIKALETQIEHLLSNQDQTSSVSADVEALNADELRARLLKLQKDYDAINKDLPVIEKAYRKSMLLGKKKIMDFAALEEKVALLIAEKAKADQKYFAAHKDTDTRKAEIRALRAHNTKSSELIAQLKEVEGQNRTLLSNLEKQLSDLKQSNMSVVTENKRLESLSSDAQRRLESSKGQITDLTNLVKAKDAASIALRERASTLEAEAERLKVRLDSVQKDRDNWKAKSLSNTSVDEDMLRVSFRYFLPMIESGQLGLTRNAETRHVLRLPQ
jgi:E3 ubiquitin-protein ligase BRE1